MTSPLNSCVKLSLLFALILLSNAAASFAQKPNEMPSSKNSIRISVGRVDVNATVTDSHGHFISGLHREDFRVFDNGVERPITAFASNNDPSQVVLLIECGTADFLLAKLARGLFLNVETFLNRLPPSDRIAIVTYSDHARLVLDFTSEKPAVRLALRDLNSQLLHSAVGSGSLDLSASLAAVLYWLRSVPGKKTIVLLSTGIDNSSPNSWQTVQQTLKTSDVNILAVSAFGDLRKFPAHRKLSSDDRAERAFVKQGISDADQWLHQLSTATGGHVYFPKDAKDFDHAYVDIAQLVLGQYNLAFAPSSLDGKIHSIDVKVKAPWYRRYHVDHREAYIAGAEAAN
ncbi:MAG: VWA domain-containing protein [Candidatus Acidiferrales bacterium]